MNEMTELERFRSDVPELDLTDVRAEEHRLLSAMRDVAPEHGRSTGRRVSRRGVRLRIGLAAGLGVAAAAAGVIVVNAGGEPGSPPVVHTMPVASVQVLKRAADHAARSSELHPRPGQFLVFDSRTMDTVESNSGGRQERYLDRQERKIWLPVDGDATHGVLQSRTLEPKPYPGWPVPAEARQNVGRSSRSKAADFDDRAEHLRNDYAYLSRLPPIRRRCTTTCTSAWAPAPQPTPRRGRTSAACSQRPTCPARSGPRCSGRRRPSTASPPSAARWTRQAGPVSPSRWTRPVAAAARSTSSTTRPTSSSDIAASSPRPRRRGPRSGAC
ncbi:hypothetical protein ACFQY7_43400 [Actinomadura luteofluorescens]|uniref:hypothetical protein n=1 Tax=Actinomadura luteofluorescens TaxID=46163 RepID=UPI0036399078